MKNPEAELTNIGFYIALCCILVQYSTNKFSLFKTKMNTATYSIQYILNNDFKLILLKFLKHVSGM